MTKRTCTSAGCDRAHWARGMCSTHYGNWHRAACGRKLFTKVCEACEEEWQTATQATRYCSSFCKTYGRFGPQWSVWPATARRTARVKPEPFSESRECRWCGSMFAARMNTQTYCSPDHKARAKRVRRRGRQHGWTSNFTWAEVMQVWLRFNRCCAYCEQRISTSPDPDHVVPLSRGGCNSITNILPCCSLCNSDKRDLLLSEWNADRARRGLPARVTAWDYDDLRVRHLTVDAGHLSVE